MKKNSLHLWLEGSTLAQRHKLAKLASTTPRQIDHLAKGHRRASAELALRIEHASGRMMRYGLPLVLREDLAEACGRCDFVRKCRELAA